MRPTRPKNRRTSLQAIESSLSERPPAPSSTFQPTHRFFVRVKGEDGKEPDNIFTHITSEKENERHSIILSDSRGLAILTDQPDMSFEFKISASGYAEAIEDLNLGAVAEDHVFQVRLSLLSRPKTGPTVKGQVIDSTGKPVPGAMVVAYKPYVAPEAGQPDRGRWPSEDYLGDATTDDEGRFSLPGPLEGRLSVLDDRFTFEDKPMDLRPGWTDGVPVHPDSGEVTIKLRPGGTARVLFPPGYDAAKCFRLEWSVMSGYWIRGNHLDARGWAYEHLRPGTWQVLWREPRVQFYPGGWVGPEPAVFAKFQVQEGKESVVDLREGPAKALLPVRCKVKVSADGKPLSGAEVLAFATWGRADPKLAAAVNDLGDERPEIRDRAEAVLRQAGKAGIGQILASTQPDNTDVRKMIERVFRFFEESGHRPDGGSGVLATAIDLTDDDGTAEFQALPGRRYVVVARMPGRWIGVKSFHVSGPKPEPVELAVVRARTIELVSPEGLPLFDSSGKRPENVRVDMDFLTPDEVIALGAAHGFRRGIESPARAQDLARPARRAAIPGRLAGQEVRPGRTRGTDR